MTPHKLHFFVVSKLGYDEQWEKKQFSRFILFMIELLREFILQY